MSRQFLKGLPVSIMWAMRAWVSGADRAGRAERMAERDRAAERVDDGRVETDVADHRQ